MTRQTLQYLLDSDTYIQQRHLHQKAQDHTSPHLTTSGMTRIAAGTAFKSSSASSETFHQPQLLALRAFAPSTSTMLSERQSTAPRNDFSLPSALQCETGHIHDRIAECLCASSLIPSKKKGNGVRPIALGDTIWRLFGKRFMRSEDTLRSLSSLRPNQLGFNG